MKISCVSNEKMPQLYFVSLYSNVLFCYETNMPKSLMCFFVTKIIKYKQPIWQRPVFCKLKTPTLKRKTREKGRVGHPFFSKERSVLAVLFRSL